MLLARIGDRIIGVLTIALTARYLTPADFGTFQMAFSVVALVQVFSLLGFEWALIRHPDPQPEHFHTAFTMQLTLSTAAAVIILALAWPFSLYYRTPELLAAIMVMSLAPIFHGLENLAVAHLRRELRFEADFWRMFVPRVAASIACIGLAIWWQSCWALVVGLLVQRGGVTVIGYWLHPYRPRLTYAKWRELIGFSAWLQLNSIIEGFRTRCADLIIGRALGSHSLAIFNMSGELANLPQSEFVGAINTAMFPRYSRMQNEPDLVRTAYLDIVAVSILVGLPAAVGLAFTAPAAVRLLLGTAWVEVVPVIQIMAFGALASAIAANSSFVLMTMGRPDINAWLSAGGLGVLLTLLVVMTSRHGMIGAAVGFTATALILLPIHFIVLSRVLGVPVGGLLPRTYRAMLAACVMAAPLALLAPSGSPSGMLEAALVLAAMAIAGSLSYGVALGLLWLAAGRPEGIEQLAFRIIGQILEKFRVRLIPRRG